MQCYLPGMKFTSVHLIGIETAHCLSEQKRINIKFTEVEMTTAEMGGLPTEILQNGV